MNKSRSKKVASLVLVGSLLVTGGCGKTKEEVSAPVSTPEVTQGPEKFRGNMRTIIENMAVLKNTKVYENLSVTGKKLGDLDIYLDKDEDKYVVICGQSLVYLPIDKDGVVKLKDGIYKYWKESKSTFNYVLVGKYAEKMEKQQEEVATGDALNVYIDDYLCKDVSVWYSEDGEMIMMNLESVCKAVGIKYTDTGSGVVLTSLNGDLEITIDENSIVHYKDNYIDCQDVEYTKTGCIIGTAFLEDVLGIAVAEDGNNLSLYGELVPEVVLLDNYTATGAEQKPLTGKNKGISILKVFGEFDQSKEIEEGKVSHQVFFSFNN